VQCAVDRAAAETLISSAACPVWNDYLPEFTLGVPVLHSASVSVDFRPVQKSLAAVVRALSVNDRLPHAITGQMHQLNAVLDRDEEWPSRVVTWLLERGSPTTAAPGLVRYMGWTVLRRYLSAFVESFTLWRDEELWLRAYCPTCGAIPALAQLTGSEPGRVRLLVCGCCATHWRYRRTGCAFCNNANDRQLSTFTLPGTDPLRIDHCKECNGYIKTYAAEGEESVFLADWTSLHLDIVAQDRGLQRYAGSLYQI